MFLSRARMRSIRGRAEGDGTPEDSDDRHRSRPARERTGSRLPGLARPQSGLQAEVPENLRERVRGHSHRARCLGPGREEREVPLRKRELLDLGGIRHANYSDTPASYFASHFVAVDICDRYRRFRQRARTRPGLGVKRRLPKGFVMKPNGLAK